MHDLNRLRISVICAGIVAVVAIGIAPKASSATPSMRPSAPQTVHATAGDGFAIVSWLKPKSNGGHAVTRYVVTSHPTKATCTTSPQGTICTLWELTNETPYTFT